MLRLGNGQTAKVGGDALVQVGKGAHARLIIRPEHDCIIETDLGAGCSLETFLICQKSVNASIKNRLDAGSRLDAFSLWLGGGEGRVQNSLEGERAHASDMHIFVAGDSASFRLDCVLRHCSKNTGGEVQARGIVRDSARADLSGLIKIGPDGSGAESFLSEHIMLMNPGAHASADPKLEIGNNDVSSRHSASVSQIDMSKVFYLMSRGLGRDEARMMIAAGFLESALMRIRDDDMREEFEGLVRGPLPG